MSSLEIGIGTASVMNRPILLLLLPYFEGIFFLVVLLKVK